MQLTFSGPLITLLSAATTKTQWFNILSSALGSSRRVVCEKNGSEFRNCALTGNMQLVAGVITGLGFTAGTTVSLAADLSSGVSTLSIQGNGHWIKGTLGLDGSGCNFTLGVNPTTSNGLAFGSIAINPPAALLELTIAPTLNSAAPAIWELEDWSTGSAVSKGTATLSVAAPDWVFEDADVANELGTIRVTNTSASIVLGTGSDAFEFAPIMLAMHGISNSTANVIWYQVGVTCKPYARWASYPAVDTYNHTTDNTIPAAFKIKLKKADGTLLYTFERHDGKAINDPSQSQVPSGTLAWEPFWNCGMMLEWKSATPRMAARAYHYFPGMTADSIRPTQAKQSASSNGSVPSGGGVLNGYNQMYGMMRWPQAGSATVDSLDISNDPYIYNTSSSDGAPNSPWYKPRRLTGWDYDPGSISGHDWLTGPGGIRFDRSAIPAQLALYMTDPNGSRLRDGVPYRQMVDAFGKAHFNHSHHWVTNALSGATISDTEAVAGSWNFDQAYYGGSSKTTNKTVKLHYGFEEFNKNGFKVWNGWALDHLHSYATPGWWALLFNSPLHAYSAKLRFNAHWMASLGESGISSYANGIYLARLHAWRWMHLTMMWKLASNHTLGHSRTTVFNRFVAEVEMMYDTIYAPAVVSNNPSAYFTGLRNLGIPVNDNEGVGGDYNNGSPAINHHGQTISNGLTYYMNQVMMLMKQTGLWTQLRVASTKCTLAMDYMVANMIKYSCEFINVTNGKKEDYISVDTKPMGTPLVIPANWAAWLAANPKVGAEDWITDSSGAPIERETSQHLRATFPDMLVKFYPEYVTTEVTQAQAKYAAFYATRLSQVNAAVGASAQRNADWTFRNPAMGYLAAPDTVGA